MEWGEVLAMARDALLYDEVDRDVEVVVAQEAPCKPAVVATQPPTAAPISVPSAPVAPVAGGSSGGSRPQKKCAYCAPLGLGMDNHDQKWCYIDPSS